MPIKRRITRFLTLLLLLPSFILVADVITSSQIADGYEMPLENIQIIKEDGEQLVFRAWASNSLGEGEGAGYLPQIIISKKQQGHAEPSILIERIKTAVKEKKGVWFTGKFVVIKPAEEVVMEHNGATEATHKIETKPGSSAVVESDNGKVAALYSPENILFASTIEVDSTITKKSVPRKKK